MPAPRVSSPWKFPDSRIVIAGRGRNPAGRHIPLAAPAFARFGRAAALACALLAIAVAAGSARGAEPESCAPAGRAGAQTNGATLDRVEALSFALLAEGMAAHARAEALAQAGDTLEAGRALSEAKDLYRGAIYHGVAKGPLAADFTLTPSAKLAARRLGLLLVEQPPPDAPEGLAWLVLAAIDEVHETDRLAALLAAEYGLKGLDPAAVADATTLAAAWLRARW